MKASEKIIETWLKNDGWIYNKQDTGQEGGIQYIITLKNKKKLHLFLDGNVGKITLSYLYHLSSEIQGLGESLTLDFLYDLRIDLLLLDVYLKFYSNDKTLKLKSFIFWEEISEINSYILCIKWNKLLIYVRWKIMDLLGIIRLILWSNSSPLC